MSHASRLHPYLLASLWAGALVASSYFGRGHAVGTWVDAALYTLAGVWLALVVARRPRR